MDKKLVQSVKKHEGFRTKAYKDQKGHWTIGYGSKMDRDGFPAKLSPHITITEEAAEFLLDEDLAEALMDAKTFPQFAKMNRARRNVFVEMVFQMGRTRVARFVNMLGSISLNTQIKPTNWEIVSNHMLDSKWHREDSPERAVELANTMRVGWYG